MDEIFGTRARTSDAARTHISGKESSRSRAWIALAVINALPLLFGSSYIWFPSDAVKAADGTEGIVHLEAAVWGSIVLVSAVAMLAAVVFGFRRRERWSWFVLWYSVGFYVAVAVIEPDYFLPLIFAAISAGILVRSRHRMRQVSPTRTSPAS